MVKKYGNQPNFRTDKDYSAVQYYAEAYEFWQRLENYGILELRKSDAVDENNTKITKFGNDLIFKDDVNPIEEPNSNFNQHRLEIIRYSIEKNLSIAIANYNNYVGQGKANFQMPELKENEWDKILNNVSIISFLQGINIGGKIYNGYSIITNTKNKEVVTEEAIYITGGDNNQYYYNAKYKDLASQNPTRGVLNIDFERKSRTNDSGTIENFYPQKQFADYSSVVNQSDVVETDNIYKYMDSLTGIEGKKVAKLYYTALARERKSSYKSVLNSNKSMTSQIYQQKQQYTLSISYVDETNNEIKTQFKMAINEGENYDISANIDDTILNGSDKYKYSYATGETSGEITGDTNIILNYKKLNTFNIKVKYVDEETGNELADAVIIKNGYEGENYSLTSLELNQEPIAGYSFTRQEGDMTGVFDSDKEIILYYKKLNTYAVTLKYLYKYNNNTLLEPITLYTGYEGTNYNVENDVNSKMQSNIGNYEYSSKAGDATSGILDSNKEIILYYKKNKKIFICTLEERNMSDISILKLILNEKYSTVTVKRYSKDDINGQFRTSLKLQLENGKYDLVICDTMCWDLPNNLFNNDLHNCNVITISNDATSSTNNLISNGRNLGNNSYNMIPYNIDENIFKGISLKSEADGGGFAVINFKSNVNVIGKMELSNNSIYDAIGWKITSEGYKKIHSQFAFMGNDTYAKVLNCLIDFALK